MKMIDLKNRDMADVLAIFQHVGAKRCPFCGEEAHLHFSPPREAGHDGWATLGCRTDDCRGNTPMGVPPVADFEKEMARLNRRANNRITGAKRTEKGTA